MNRKSGICNNAYTGFNNNDQIIPIDIRALFISNCLSIIHAIALSPIK